MWVLTPDAARAKTALHGIRAERSGGDDLCGSGGSAVTEVRDERVRAGFDDMSATGPGPDHSCPACGAARMAVLGAPGDKALLLTSRERAVFRLLGDGYDNRSIARELEISERTVKRYVTAILTKLGLESRLQAGLAALVIWSSGATDGYWPKGRNGFLHEQRATLLMAVNPDAQERPMAFDALATLRQAGNPVDLLSEEQRSVLAQLTEEEVTVLNSVKERLDAVSDAEVEGQSLTIKIA
jgi:DNA-binding CsgD family transcriptional regulator